MAIKIWEEEEVKKTSTNKTNNSSSKLQTNPSASKIDKVLNTRTKLPTLAKSVTNKTTKKDNSYNIKTDINSVIYDKDGNYNSKETLANYQKQMIKYNNSYSNPLTEEEQRKYQSDLSKIKTAQEAIKANEKETKKVDEQAQKYSSTWFDSNGNLRDYESENKAIDEQLNKNSIILADLENSLQRGDYSSQNEYSALLGENAKLSKQKMDNEASLKALNKYSQIYGVEEQRVDAIKKGDYETADYLMGLQASSDDNDIQRMATATAKNIGQIANTIDRTIDIVKDIGGEVKGKLTEERAKSLYADGRITSGEYEGMLKDAKTYREFDANNPDNMSVKIDKKLSQMNEEVLYNTDGVRKTILQTLDSTENFLMQYALFGEYSTAIMGLQSGSQKVIENLDNGYDMTTSVLNGTAYGVVSYLTEKIGMDSFVGMLNNKAGQYAMAEIFGNVANSVITQGSSEALEELVEALGDHVVDGITHILNNDYEVNFEVESLPESMLIAFLSGGLTGAYASMQYNVSTREEATKLKSDIQGLVNLYEEAKANGDTAAMDMYEGAIRLGNNALYNYSSNTLVGDAIQFAKDNVVNKPMTLNEATSKLFQTFKPNLDADVNARIDEQVALRDITTSAQNVLKQKGINYDASKYVNLSKETRANVDKVASSLNDMGINYRFEDLQTDNGKVVDGYYDSTTKQFVVNPNAKNGVVSASVHELVHTIEDQGTYQTLKNTLYNVLEKEGANIIDGVKNIHQRYLNAGIKQDFKVSEADYVAEEIQKRLGTQSFVNELVKYSNDAIYRLYSNAINNFGGANAQIGNLFKRALKTKFDSGDFSSFGENTFTPSTAQFSIAQWWNGGRELSIEYLKSRNFDEAYIESYVNDLDSVANYLQSLIDTGNYEHFANWSLTDVITDEDGNVSSCVVTNGEYELNIDFSTICKKREMQNRVLNELATSGALDEIFLRPTDMVAIRSILQAHNLEVACSVCFVDSKRFRQGTWAKSFVSEYNKVVNMLTTNGVPTNQSNYANPNIVQVANGLETLSNEDLRRLNPKGVEQVEKYIKDNYTEKGNPSKKSLMAKAILENPQLRIRLNGGDFYGDEAFDRMHQENARLYALAYAWGGQSKPKTPFAEVTYNNDIFTKIGFNPEKAFAMGGFRNNSFSDYQANMIFDYLNMIYEASAKGLPMQAYTKVETFVRLFGMTGAKINMSIINRATELSSKDVESLKKSLSKKSATNNDKNAWVQYQNDNAGLKTYSIDEVNAMSNEERQNLIDNYGLGLSQDGTRYTAYLIDELSETKKTTESFDWRTALEIQSDPRYAGKVGTIVIGFGREHIYKLLADNNVKMVIPYHKSGINGQVGKSVNISMIVDYTDHQTTKNAKGDSINDKWFNFYDKMKTLKDARAVANEYLRECDERGYTPKFNEFRGDPNYYKLLVDYNPYSDAENTVFAEQEPLQMNFPNEFTDIVVDSLREYETDKAYKDSKMPAVMNDIYDYLGNPKGWDITTGTKKSSVPSNAQLSIAEDNYNQADIDIMNASNAQNNAINEVMGTTKADTLDREIEMNNNLNDSMNDWFKDYDVLRNTYPEIPKDTLDQAIMSIVYQTQKEGTTTSDLKDTFKKAIVSDENIDMSNPVISSSISQAVDDAVNLLVTTIKSNTSEMRKAANTTLNFADTYVDGTMSTDSFISEFNKVINKDRVKKNIEYNRKQERMGFGDLINNIRTNGKDKWVAATRTLEQNLDYIANGNAELRKELGETFEFPRQIAQAEYVECLNDGKNIIEQIKKIGIKANSMEAYGVLYHLENPKGNLDGFSNEQIARIKEASKLLKGQYENIYSRINNYRMSNVYGNISEDNRVELAKKLTEANKWHKVVLKLGEDLAKDTTNKALQASYNKALQYRKKAINAYNALAESIDSGDAERRQLLQYKENYTHHTYKDDTFFRKLSNAFKGDNPVPTDIAGKTEDVKPRSVFETFLLRQSVNFGDYDTFEKAYKQMQKIGINDAITSYKSYVEDSAKMIAYDPYVNHLRNFENELRKTIGKGTEANNLVTWLSKYTNNIIGKRNSLDREMQSLEFKPISRVMNVLNSQAKKSVIPFNVRSALVQFANIPNGISILARDGVQGDIDFAKGIGSYVANMNMADAPHLSSPFLSARFFDIDLGIDSFKAKADKVAKAMMTKGDQIGTYLIWYGAYEQALRKGDSIDVDPITYADDITRRAVAGRSIGETPIALQSGLINLIAPFQVEVNNQFHTMLQNVASKDPNISKHRVSTIISGQVAIWLINSLYEAILRDRVVEGDYINAIIEGFKNALGEDGLEDNDGSKFVLRILGEGLSTLPASSIATMLMGWNDDERKELFGDVDPSRYGTGNLGLSGIADAIADHDNMGEAIADILSSYMTGGTQARRTIEGLQSVGVIPKQKADGTWEASKANYTKSGNISFVNEGTIEDYIRAALFGKWNTDAAQEYIDRNFKPLGKKQTSAIQSMSEAGMDIGDAYKNFLNSYEEIDALKNDDNPNNKEQIIDYLKGSEADYKEQNATYDYYYGNSDFISYVNDLDIDDETRLKVKYASGITSMKDANGETIKNSKALQIRKEYEDLGVYDTIIKYIEDNGLNAGDFNLNKTVVKMSSDEFNSAYDSLMGKDTKTSSSGGKVSKSRSNVIKSLKLTTSQEKSMREIMEDTKSDVEAIKKKYLAKGLYDIIQRYLKEHPGTDKSMFGL